MATKRKGVACYDNAGMDEELFCLRAQDKLAPYVVRYWAWLRSGGEPMRELELHCNLTAPKVPDALNCATRMENQKIPKKLPD